MGIIICIIQEENEDQRKSESPRNHPTDQQPSQDANLSLILTSMLFPLDKLANHDPWIKSSLPPVLKITVLLELSHAICLHMVRGHFRTTTAKPSDRHRDHMAPKPLKSLLSVSSQRMFTDPDKEQTESSRGMTPLS